MSELNVAIRRLAHGRRFDLPAYKTDGAAGMDLIAAIDTAIGLAPGERCLCPTGIEIALPEHSTEEALSVSDRAGVLSGGRLVQTGAMEQLIRRPRNETVARLLHAENIFCARAVPDGQGAALIRFAGGEIRVPGGRQGELKFTARPESLRVLPDGESATNTVRAVLSRVDYRGSHWHLEFDAGTSIMVYLRPDDVAGGLEPGRPYMVQFPAEAVHILED